MPISVRYLNDPSQECVIRPAPLVSIGDTTIRNADGQLGKTYSITINGDILVDQGFPLARDSRTDSLFDYFGPSGTYVPANGNAGPYKSFDSTQSHAYEPGVVDNRPEQQYIPFSAAVDAMLFKQKVIRSLFAKDGQRLEISPVHVDEPAVVCYPRVVDISFEDGIYVDRCKYTIQLEADALYDNNLEVDLDGNPIQIEGNTFDQIIANSGRFIESYSETWDLEVDDSIGESANLTKSYRITRNISANGKNTYGPNSLLPSGQESPNRLQAWEQARDFVHFKLSNEPVSSGYPNVMGKIGSGILNLTDAYDGYSHSRNENISISDGSYGISETWLLASGSAYENYNASLTASIGEPFIGVSLQGEINGLSTFKPTSESYGGPDQGGISAYDNALSKYYQISNSGSFGVGSDVYKRANSLVAVELNAQPKSLSVALNEYDGSINYNIEFDNRPTNIFSGVITENISISDTYPGDVFSSTSVIGRDTGPVLNYGGSRTEYQRTLDLNMVMDYNNIPYGSGRSLITKKPSVSEPVRSQLIQVLQELSPQYEPNIRKWFISPPVENWEPKTGVYSFNVTWTYELSD